MVALGRPFALRKREYGALRKNSGRAAFIAALLFSLNLAETDTAWGAFSPKLIQSEPMQLTQAEESGSTAASAPEITDVPSGLAYFGAQDCLLESSPANGDDGSRVSVHINYPAVGNSAIDEDIRDWVKSMADAFVSHIDNALLISNEPEDKTGDFINGLDEDQAPHSISPRYELWGLYNLTRPSDAVLSIAFELWNYTGNSEGNLDVITLNYNLHTGQRLNFVDIFEKPETALELMSNWSRKELDTRLGALRRPKMVETGTAPLVENFSSFIFTPDGICINFQPWQVAPSSAGIQRINMPLEELMPSLPMLDLWGRG